MMLEEVGEEYFEDLTSRSFFLVYKGECEGDILFTMHDLVNDLATFVSGESCLRLDNNCSGNLTRRTRHISCVGHQMPHYMAQKLEDLSENNVLRTLLVLDNWGQLPTQHVINPEQLGLMQYLRVLLRTLLVLVNWGNRGEHVINPEQLLLRYCSSLHKLPESIDNLKHLRYLDSSDTPIEKIPDTLGNLHELHIGFISRIEKIPDTLGNLHKLRTLDLSHTPIEKIPGTIFSLHELHTLYVCNRLQWLP
ncbi:hypothetical protein FNV43_RR15283 [Rhamnella rubrinervis]|uniref:Disease resistance protein winged helix domain-containing protein n=1 Tax=Rhamnella rubrinervis TaxID=2594499 RepID=A0A8K0GWN7_9ROSA|nr:hypothetical protein FNV43_RR15283 [Rhamnella rubrinervis]